MKKKNAVFLALAAIIWGFAFSAQKVGNVMGPFAFNGIRSIIGALILLPIIPLLRKYEQGKNGTVRELLKGGILCGLCLCAGSNLQQVGLQYTSAGKAGFITAMYIVMVPVAGIAFRKKCSVNAWIGVCLSVAGLVCLSLLTDSATGSNEMLGNALVLLAAVAFTAHILVIDRFAPNLNGVALSCVQFFTSGILTLVLMLLFEKPVISVILSEPVAVLYAGIMSCGVAYTFQILGQDGANPTLASLILCLESVFSVIGGILFLHDSMDAIEWIGCALMFGGIVISQLPDRKKAEGAGNASESQKAD